MQKFRNLSAPAAWLMLAAFVLGGGLVATHSHDGPTRGELSSVGGYDLPATAKYVESSTAIDVDMELCPACAAGGRQGVLDASRSTSRSPVMVTRGVRVADCFAISASDARPPAPRGPPIV